MTTLVHPGLGDLGGVIALGTQQPRSMGWTLRGLGHQGGLPGHEPLAASTASGPLWSRPQLTSQAHWHLHPATAPPKSRTPGLAALGEVPLSPFLLGGGSPSSASYSLSTYVGNSLKTGLFWVSDGSCRLRPRGRGWEGCCERKGARRKDTQALRRFLGGLHAP